MKMYKLLGTVCLWGVFMATYNLEIGACSHFDYLMLAGALGICAVICLYECQRLRAAAYRARKREKFRRWAAEDRSA